MKEESVLQRTAIYGGTIITVMTMVCLTMLAIAYMWSPEFSSVEERERLFVSGFNEGWLSHADCVAWAFEDGARDLAEAYYWADYNCPYAEVSE